MRLNPRKKDFAFYTSLKFPHATHGIRTVFYASVLFCVECKHFSIGFRHSCLFLKFFFNLAVICGLFAHPHRSVEVSFLSNSLMPHNCCAGGGWSTNRGPDSPQFRPRGVGRTGFAPGSPHVRFFQTPPCHIWDLSLEGGPNCTYPQNDILCLCGAFVGV